MAVNRRRLFAGLLALDLALGVTFAGLAVVSAQADETPAASNSPSDPPSPDPTPTDPMPVPEPSPSTSSGSGGGGTGSGTNGATTGDGWGPTVAGAPIAAAITNTDGSFETPWLTGISGEVRDASDPNYNLFKDMYFRVSQTQNLSFQVVNVSWEGGVPSSTGEFSHDFVQIMQCWDDGSGHAKPENCQWGAPSSALGGITGQNTPNRNLKNNEDSKQTYGADQLIPPPPGNPNLHQYEIPFVTVDGQSTFDVHDYFDWTLSNEVTGSPTAQDGTGDQAFEVQTSAEAPHLGCGNALPGGDIQNCWLVIVPRGEYSASGQNYQDSLTGRLDSSPLTASNWADRVEVPMSFKSVTTACQLGADEIRTMGNEPIGSAMYSWQAGLCAGSKVYGFSQIGDGEVRRQLVSTTPSAARLGFISNPLDSTTAGTATLKYAPVAKTATVIAFNIDYLLGSNSAIFDQNGRPVTDLTLNARLVAKLLTQSYRNDVPDGNNQTYLATNPRSMRQDPEFLQLNPQFNDFVSYIEPGGFLTALGNSDAFAAVWAWINADPDALAFLNGAPDQWGMTVNPNYQDLDIPHDSAIDSFPKADPSYFRENDSVPAPGYGSFDLRPYMLDQSDVALKVRRADPGSKTYWDETKNPPSFISQGPMTLGRKFILGLTTYAGALRLGLPMAKLINSGGYPVEPTNDTIDAAISEFTPNTTLGVKVFNPAVTGTDSYPLAVMDYAVTNVCAATSDQLKAYAGLLTYVAGNGQVVGDAYGQLPQGYAPLSADEVRATTDVATALSASTAQTACPKTAVPTPTPTASASKAAVVPIATPSASASASTGLVAEGAPHHTFPRDPAAVTKFALLSALFLGVPSIAGGRTLIRKSKSLDA